jgi:hypothetical protein
LQSPNVIPGLKVVDLGSWCFETEHKDSELFEMWTSGIFIVLHKKLYR